MFEQKSFDECAPTFLMGTCLFEDFVVYNLKRFFFVCVLKIASKKGKLSVTQQVYELVN